MNKADQDKANNGITYSSREKGLRDDMPLSLRGVNSVRISFDHARDPLISKQLKSLSQTETKNREDGDGSRMVKLHKPFPDLRPKHDISQIRKSFNQQLISEQRHEQLSQFRAQEQQLKSQSVEKLEITQPKKGMER
jgi:hypothetical protein